jgi:tetratricopeptide (TPR) repeat protein
MKIMREQWDSLLRVTVMFLVSAFLSPLPAAGEESMQVKSIEQLESEYKETPRDHDVNYEYCGKLIEVKDYSRAIEVCTLAIETGTENTLSWSYLDRGVAYRELGRLDEAKKDREKSKQHGMPKWLLDSYLKL